MTAVLVFLMFAVVEEDPGFGFAVLAPGTFHGDEVDILSGEIWSGLFRSETGVRIEPVVVTVIPAEDVVLDSEGEKTAAKVFNTGSVPFLYLYSMDDGVYLTGMVEPLLLETELVEFGDIFPLTPGEALEGREDGLFLTRNGFEQRICSVYENLYGEGLSIVFAGDLDGDGITDLIVNDCAHYNIYMGYRVFLSTYAQENELVHEVAEFTAIGC